MTGPKDPDDQEWGFPEVDPAGPASVQLPDPPPPPAAEFDTGSDAWWRAQAQAQRAAAQDEPVPPASVPVVPVVAAPAEPPALVEPQVLLPEPSPLDREWAPPPLPELHPAPEEQAEEQAWTTVEASDAPVALDQPVREIPPALPPAPISEMSFDAPQHGRHGEDAERVGPARALVGAGLALAGVALAIGALLLFGKDEPKGTPTVSLPPSPTAPPTTAPTATSAPSSPSATPTSVVTPALVAPTATTAPAPVVPVSVLNNSKIKHLAERAGARFKAGGWPVPTTGNYRGGQIATTTVYFNPGQRASAERFAKQFGIGRVAPRFPGLPTSGMTVIVTRDFA